MNPLQLALLFSVRIYQCTLSPLLTALFGAQCRFTPSCSVYTAEAIRVHGAIKGAWLGTVRICRCSPWGGCGHDPVPEVKIRLMSPNNNSI